jgi:hypothetical protein
LNCADFKAQIASWLNQPITAFNMGHIESTRNSENDNATSAIGSRRSVVCEWNIDKSKPSARFSTRDYTVFHFGDPQPGTGRGGLSLIAALKRNKTGSVLYPMDQITLKSVPNKQLYIQTLRSNTVIAELGFSGPCGPGAKFEAWIYSDSTRTVHRVCVAQIKKADDAVNRGTDQALKSLVQAELNKPLTPQQQPKPRDSIDGAESVLITVAQPGDGQASGDEIKQPIKTPKKTSKSVSFVLGTSLFRVLIITCLANPTAERQFANGQLFV